MKKNLNKNSIAVKTLHKELQASRLESEQAGSDLTAAEEQLAEADSAMQAQIEEIETLKKEQTRIKVRSFSQLWWMAILTCPGRP